MNLIKLVGIFIVFSVCALSGMAISFCLRKRAENLRCICYSLSSLRNGINHSGRELGDILGCSFENCRFIEFEGTGPMINDTFALKEKDISMLKEFFGVLGTDAVSGENDKITLYLDSFERERKTAEKEAESKCKIFTVSGFCIGLTAAILFL